MNQHDTADRRVIPAQFISFLLAGVIGLLGDSLLNRPATAIAIKFADAIFITDCILVAMKLARKGWDLPAASYTVLSIAWGGSVLANDFASQEIGRDIAGLVFYFLLPSLIMMAFYRPFPRWIKIVTSGQAAFPVAAYRHENIYAVRLREPDSEAGLNPDSPD